MRRCFLCVSTGCICYIDNKKNVGGRTLRCVAAFVCYDRLFSLYEDFVWVIFFCTDEDLDDTMNARALDCSEADSDWLCDHVWTCLILCCRAAILGIHSQSKSLQQRSKISSCLASFVLPLSSVSDGKMSSYPSNWQIRKSTYE